jgi:hemolysin III
MGVVVKAAGIKRRRRGQRPLHRSRLDRHVALPVVVTSIPPSGLALMLTGGIAYTVGAVVLLRRRPDPRPNVFGYHEVWHGCTVIGAVSHFAMVWLIAA